MKKKNTTTFKDEDVTWTICPNCKKAVYGTSKVTGTINLTYLKLGKKKASWEKLN